MADNAVGTDNGQFAGARTGTDDGSGGGYNNDGEPVGMTVTEVPVVPVARFFLLHLAGLI